MKDDEFTLPEEDRKDDNVSLLKPSDLGIRESEEFGVTKFESVLQVKMKEIEDRWEEQNKMLEDIHLQKERLNNEEQVIHAELSGLHGAKVCLEQLAEENGVKTKPVEVVTEDSLG